MTGEEIGGRLAPLLARACEATNVVIDQVELIAGRDALKHLVADQHHNRE